MNDIETLDYAGKIPAGFIIERNSDIQVIFSIQSGKIAFDVISKSR